MKRVIGGAAMLVVMLMLALAACGVELDGVSDGTRQISGITVDGTAARSFVVQAGPVAQLKLADVWSEAAVTGQFGVKKADLQNLSLEYDSSGFLLAARIQSVTSSGSHVTVAFRGRADETPDVRQAVFSITVATSEEVLDVAVVDKPATATALSAIDAVLTDDVFSQMPNTANSAYNSVELLPANGDVSACIDDQMTALLWDGNALVPLPAGDNQRQYDQEHLFLAVYNAQPEDDGGETGVTMTSSSSPVALVIPLSYWR